MLIICHSSRDCRNGKIDFSVNLPLNNLSAFKFLNQDFKKLRDECLKKGKLFEDPLFEPSDSILRKSDKYKWLRPKEINRDAKFYVEGFSRFDVSQGDIGDCWLLAAIASLTQDPKLFFNVVHEDNSLDENYAGIFHFR